VGRQVTRASSIRAGTNFAKKTFARQKKMGVVPRDCQLTSRHSEIPAWDTVDPKMKPVLCRQMEVYAGFMEQTDFHVGRVIDAMADLKILGDTVVYLIIGDNGASAEGSLQGTFQRDGNSRRIWTSGNRRKPDATYRRIRRSELLQPLCGRLGARHGHALSMDEAGGVALRWHAQWRDHPLAEWHQGQGRDADTVPPCHRLSLRRFSNSPACRSR